MDHVFPCAGARFKVEGLVTSVHLNGQCGSIKRLLKRGDRVCVVRDSTSGEGAELSMKTSNLVSLKSLCHQCGATSNSLMDCPRCRLISFCGPACFSKAWIGEPGGHKEECKATHTVPDLQSHNGPTEAQLDIERDLNEAVEAEDWTRAKGMERQAVVVARALQCSSPDLAASIDCSSGHIFVH